MLASCIEVQPKGDSRASFLVMLALKFLIVAMLASLATSLRFVAPNRFARAFARAATTSPAGQAGTETYRVFFKDGDKNISPWHDIPLKSGDLFNFVNEIPK